MSFTTLDHRQIDFIQALHSKAPNLNSAQIIERTHSFFGAYPSRQVTTWLYHSMGDFAPARADAGGSDGAESVETGRVQEDGGRKEPESVQSAKSSVPSVQERLRGAPWGR